jgi:outer membrane murein-binding lipoprotein Lpp
MKKQRNRIVAALLLAVSTVLGGTVSAATLNDIFAVAEQLNSEARQSQAKIDALTEETRQLLGEYKTVLKEIQGLRVYNRQLEKQISNQEAEMAQLTKSIDEVTVIERQITPLMLRMIDGLEQFVSLDLPFLMEERENRLETLREIMDRADVAVSEQLSQILRAYQIENEYGRTISAYPDTINVGGTDRVVDVLQLGRVALMYQTPDGEETGRYNPDTRAWEPVDDIYKTQVQNGIRMARQQLSYDLLTLPVSGPEDAQ